MKGEIALRVKTNILLFSLPALKRAHSLPLNEANRKLQSMKAPTFSHQHIDLLDPLFRVYFNVIILW